MKPTRREFLKVSGLGALGAVVFQACGIPEQEITAQSPAEMPEDLVSGLEAWYATLCGQCAAGEGIIVRSIEGRAIKIEGNPDHPVNQGKTSARCQAGLQALYNPDRISGPLRLVGGRGSGEYEPIDWGTALDTLAGKLRRADSSKAVLATNPLRGSLGMVAQRFMKAYGGTYITHEPVEQTVVRAAVKEVFGQDRLPEFDIARADHILSFGADFLGTWLSPVHYARSYGEFRQGQEGVAPATRKRGTLTHVEPHFSLTAANADEWVYVNPGYEGILALSIAYVLVDEGLAKEDAVRAMTGKAGREARDVLGAFAPGNVENAMGVTAARITNLAKELGGSGRSLVIGGGSAAAHTNGLFNMKAIYSLNYLVGSVGREGGVLFNPPSPLEDAPAPVAASFKEWQEVAERMRQGSVSLLMVRGANPMYGLPRALEPERMLERVNTIVAFSSFMDETTIGADLILPEPTYLETWGDDIPEPGPGYQTVTLQQPVVKPFQGTDTLAFGDVLLTVAESLAGQMAAELPWRNMQDVLRANAWLLHDRNRGSIHGGSREEFWNAVLRRGGWWDTGTRGPSEAGAPPELSKQPIAPEFEGDMGQYPFYLMPFSSLSLGEGQGANLPWLQATPDPLTTAVWHTWGEINVKDAEELGIREGDVLKIEAPGGRSIEVLAYPHLAAAPKVIAIPFGQGHTVYGDFEIGIGLKKTLVGKGRGANVFDVLAPKRDNDTGALAWAATRVKVSKTGEWARLSKLEGTVTPVALPGQPIVQVTRPE